MRIVVPPIYTLQDAWRVLDEIARAFNDLDGKALVDGDIGIATTTVPGITEVDNNSGGSPKALTQAGHGSAASPHLGHAHLVGGLVAPAELGIGLADNTTYLRGDQTYAAPPVGAPGSPGSAGTPGIPGRDGRSGSMGFPGPSGPPGTGAPGPTGAIGPSGPSGLDGRPGPMGFPIQGSQGTPGAAGAAGRDGLTIPGRDGREGRLGFPGSPGKDGVNGAQGPQGIPGPAIMMALDGKPGVMGFPMPGIQGLPGAAGAQGSQGPVGPGHVAVDGKPGPMGFPGAIPVGAFGGSWNPFPTRLSADNAAIAAAAPTTALAVAILQQQVNLNEEWSVEWILHIANSVATDVFVFNVVPTAGTFTGRVIVLGANGVPTSGVAVVKELMGPAGTITVASANAPGNTGTIALVTSVIIRAQGKQTVAPGLLTVQVRAGTSGALTSGTATVKAQSQMIATRLA